MLRRRLLLVSLIVCILGLYVFIYVVGVFKVKNAEEVVSVRTFGGGGEDVFYYVFPTTRGELLALGYTKSEEFVVDGDADALIVSFDKELNIRYWRTFSIGLDEALFRATQLKDYICAVGWAVDGSDYYGLIVFVNKNGNIVSKRAIPSSTFMDVEPFGEKLLVAGSISVRGDADFFLVILNGVVIERNITFGFGDSKDILYSVYYYCGSIYCVGKRIRTSDLKQEVFIAKLSEEGAILWNRTLREDYWGRIGYSDLIIYEDRIYISILRERLTEEGNLICWESDIACFDLQGNALWNKTFSSNVELNAIGMYIDKFGIIYLAGEIINFDLNPIQQLFLAKLDENGTVIYNETLAPFEGNIGTIGSSIYIDECGFMYIVGSNVDLNIGRIEDAFILKLGKDTDNDGITDFYEELYGTDPTKIDTDGDGFSDGIEVIQGTNPLDPNDYPSTRLENEKQFLLVIIIGVVLVSILLLVLRKSILRISSIKRDV